MMERHTGSPKEGLCVAWDVFVLAEQKDTLSEMLTTREGQLVVTLPL